MEAQRTHIDFETRSLVDLPKMGEHAYARHWSTSPLMLTIGTAPKGAVPKFETIDFFKVPGYAQSCYPNSTQEQIEWAIFKVPCPPTILAAVARGDTFVAHNARFEQAVYYYICHKKWGWPLPARWSCTAARSRYFGIRASLEGSASDLEVLTQKDARGKQFINDFCKPRKYKGAKYLGIVKDLWYEPHENPAGWQVGLEYCEIDGIAEAEIDNVLPDLPEFEQRAWDWDFTINTRGVPIDLETVGRAIQFSEYFGDAANKRFKEITDLRPTQRDRVLEYINQREEMIDSGLPDLKSKTLKRIVQDEFPADLREAITIRLDASLASIKKLERMEQVADARDGRARGGHLYGGAHTMRWSHKRIQTGNMKRSDKDVAKMVFDYFNGPWWDATPGMGHNGGPDLFSSPSDAFAKPPWVEAAQWRFMRPLGALSVSMKGFIKAEPGFELIDADFSQIEARVLAWLARCEWLLQAFRDKQDPYVKFGAEYMYNRKYEDCFEYVDGKRQVAKHFKRERQISKSAVLGAGFGLGPPKFVEYCDNSDLIITLEEAQQTIGAYREAHPEIMALHKRAEAAAIMAVANEGQTVKIGGTGLELSVWRLDTERYWLQVQFPSGRCMYYYRPKLALVQRYGRMQEQLSFRTEWNGGSYRESTYGGKLVENWVQGIARDVLVTGGLKAEKAGYPSIMLVHDSNVTMPPIGHGSPEGLVAEMCAPEPWYTDLPVEAEANRMQRYV